MSERRARTSARPLGVLVTGTDTAVGKTVVAAALVLALRARGRRALGFKPAETGLEPGEEADSALLARASGQREPRARPLLRLREPLAPAIAAERARKALRPAEVEARVRALRAAGYDVVLEGAGGLLAPLAWASAGRAYTARDLAVRLRLKAVVVARAGLGTLNHVLLTAEALARARVPLAGVVLNGRGEPPDLAERTNPAVLGRLLPGVQVVVCPRVVPGGLEAAVAIAPLLEPVAERLIAGRP